MTNDDPYEIAAAPLRAKEARLVTELDAVRQSLAAIASARAAAGAPVTVSSATPDHPTTGATLVISQGKFKGMGLGEAAAKQLSESDRIELTAKQIWAAISAAGFSILSERPEQAVSWALRKRETKERDVILVGDGKWGMVNWYSQARLKELRASRNNASGRNHAEHVEKTKAGIANAKRTRLVHWGRKRSITGEQMAKAYYAIQAGAKSKLQAAKAAGMVWPTFAWYWRYHEMEKWKPGDPFPPPKRAVEKSNSEIKLKDMWPREGRAIELTNGNGTVVGSTVPH